MLHTPLFEGHYQESILNIKGKLCSWSIFFGPFPPKPQIVEALVFEVVNKNIDKVA